MAIDTALFETDLESIEGDIAQTITVNGISYAAVVSGRTSGKDWQVSGYLPENGVEIHIRVSAGATINAGTLITHGGTVYRVISKETDPSGIAERFICEQKQ